jgi:hypothetical protein
MLLESKKKQKLSVTYNQTFARKEWEKSQDSLCRQWFKPETSQERPNQAVHPWCIRYEVHLNRTQLHSSCKVTFSLVSRVTASNLSLSDTCSQNIETLKEWTMNIWLYTEWMFNAFESFMLWSPKNNCYTLLLENISLYFILQHVFFIHFFLFPSSYALFHTFISECDCTSLQFFLQRRYTIEQATDS